MHWTTELDDRLEGMAQTRDSGRSRWESQRTGEAQLTLFPGFYPKRIYSRAFNEDLEAARHNTETGTRWSAQRVTRWNHRFVIFVHLEQCNKRFICSLKSSLLHVIFFSSMPAFTFNSMSRKYSRKQPPKPQHPSRSQPNLQPMQHNAESIPSSYAHDRPAPEYSPPPSTSTQSNPNSASPSAGGRACYNHLDPKRKPYPVFCNWRGQQCRECCTSMRPQTLYERSNGVPK